MKTRPLCYVCLFFVLFQGLLLIVKGGKSLTEIPASSIFHEAKEETVLIRGQVYKKKNTSNIQILYLKNNSVRDDKLLIYNQNFKEISIGKQILIRGKLDFFQEARNPGNFNEALYYARQNIFGVIWCEEILEISGDENKLMEWLYCLKATWKKQMIECMSDGNGGILAAMILGDKEDMNTDSKELYQNNGIGHILAISGLHISFIGLGIYHLFRKIGFRFLSSGVLAMGVLTLYVLMIGISVSVVRAYVMLALRIGADITGRVYDMLTAAMLGAALTVGYEPLWLTDGGFFMSYGAIMAICLLLPLLQQSFRNRRKWLSGCYASIAINILLFPIILWFFYEFPTYSVLINAIVLPFTGPLLGFGIFGGLFLFWFPSLGKLCLGICDLILKFFEVICMMGSQLPKSSLVLGRPNIGKMFLYYGVLLFIVLCVQFARKKRRGIWLCLLIPIFLMGYRQNGKLEIVALDVGQGDGIYIRGPEGMTYLIDGGSSDESQLGRYCIEPFLKSQGTKAVDYVFLSHGDKDHYSGIEEMLDCQEEGIVIKNLVLPINYSSDEALVELVKKAVQKNVCVSVIKEGQCLQENQMYIRCLQPSKEDEDLTGNAGSMVLEIIYDQFSMLCTGDVEGVGEELLQKKIGNRKYDVLKVAHHGSLHSTSEEFLHKVSPQFALISSGKNNRYGHPHKEVIQRLKQEGCKIYQTQENGAIILQTDGNSLTIR